MNPVNDLIVVDFCEWLKKEFVKNEKSILEIINAEDHFYLRKYAQKYLDEAKQGCKIRYLIRSFANSEELSEVISKCPHRQFYNERSHSCNRYNCLYYEIETAFMSFLEKIEDLSHKSNRVSCLDKFDSISAEQLAQFTYCLFKRNESDFMDALYCMVSSENELSLELNFLEWITTKISNPADVRKIPDIKYEEYIEKYIEESGKSSDEKRKLIKSYRQTGWESILKRIKSLPWKIKNQKKDFFEILERYFSCTVRYKCIILFRADSDSQAIYHSLISKHWNDLNSISNGFLDIYYSVKDLGKTGYDIARQITSLPSSIKYEIPCIVLWDYNLSNANAISLNELTDSQIVTLITKIVGWIEKENTFDQIIKEARNMSDVLRNENKPITNVYNNENITISGSNFGNGNSIGGTQSGGTRTTTTYSLGTKIFSNEQIFSDFNKASNLVEQSRELDDEDKNKIRKIFKDAIDAIKESGEEKIAEVKESFNTITYYLKKVAPILFKALASIASIAQFFGIK